MLDLRSPLRRRCAAFLLPLAALAGAIALSGASSPVLAQDRDAAFTAYVESLWPKARDKGVSRTTFDTMVRGLSYNPRVIALDRIIWRAARLRPTPSRPLPPIAPGMSMRRGSMAGGRPMRGWPR